MPYIGKPQSSDPITVNASNIEDGSIIAADISSSLGVAISGSFTTVSSSLGSRITLVEGGTTSKTLVSSSVQIASDISGSLGSNAAIIRSLDRTTISGSIPQALSTTSSPTFNNITATGTLTAQEIHTEFTSASILFTSGSTIFGNSSDDVHNMTGSLNISGSLFVKDGTLTVTDNVDFNGDLDVDGTTNLDVVDIDGAVQIDATFTSGVDGQGYDTKFFGDTSSAYMMWDTSEDALVFGGSAVISTQDATVSGVLKSNGGVVFNEDSADVDFRVESDVNTHMLFVDAGNNRIGIGDASPGSPLDVKSGEAANTANFNSTSGATNITFESNGSLIGQMEFVSSGTSQIVTRTSATLGLGSNNIKTLYITDDDRVGIGVASPDAKLEVTDGLGQVSTGMILHNARNANNNNVLRFQKARTSDGSNETIVSSGDYLGQIDFQGADANNAYHTGLAMYVVTEGTVQSDQMPTGLHIYTCNTSGATAERMRITADGRVGIGQSSPTNSPLEVNVTPTNATAGSSAFVHIGNGSVNTDGYISGLSLGWRENNANYRKTAIAVRARGDGAVRHDLCLLVDTANDAASATLQDAKLTIDGLTGATTLRDGIRFNATNGADPAGDDHLDVPIKFAAYTHAVDSTDVSNGSVDLDLDIYRDNYLSLNALLFDSNTNVVHAGLPADESWLKEITVYAAGQVRIHFGSSVAAGDTVKLLVSYTGNTG